MTIPTGVVHLGDAGIDAGDGKEDGDGAAAAALLDEVPHPKVDAPNDVLLSNVDGTRGSDVIPDGDTIGVTSEEIDDVAKDIGVFNE